MASKNICPTLGVLEEVLRRPVEFAGQGGRRQDSESACLESIPALLITELERLLFSKATATSRVEFRPG